MSNMNLSDDDATKTRDLSAFVFLLRFCRPDLGLVVLSLTFLVLASVAASTSAYFLGKLIETFQDNKTLDALYQVGATILVLETLSVVITYFGKRSLGLCASRAILRIRAQLFEHLQALPLRYFDTQPLGRVVTRISHDVEGLEDFFSGALARLLLAVITLVVVFSTMLIVDLKIGLILSFSVLPALVLTVGIRRPIRHWNKELARRTAHINSKLAENISGVPVIRSFGAETWSQNKFDEAVDEFLDSGIRLNIWNALSRPFILLLCLAPLLSLLIFGGPMVIAGAMSLGLFVMFVRLCERFSRPIFAIAQEIHMIQSAFAYAERVVTFLKEPNEIRSFNGDGDLDAGQIKGEIEFKNVSMSYDGATDVLKDVSFRVESGAQIGLAGRTGSGKSTCVSLIGRLYDFQKGDILLDGVSIRRYHRASLRSKLGLVSQDVVIFKGTVRENLAFGSVISEEQINFAAKSTGLLEILGRRQFDLDSVLLAQGANLSVGERQLLSLTRVVVRNPSILILDEATANIDPELERVVFRALRVAMQGRTTLIIAHRLDTIRDVNKILVFKDGMLNQLGSFEQLAQRPGYFAELLNASNTEIQPDDPHLKSEA